MEIKPLLSNQYIFSVVAVYWVVSISMVYLNKFLLSNPDASIPAPLFVTWYQCVITCAICDMLGRIGNYTRQSPPSTKSAWLTTFDKYHVTTYNPKVGMKVLPLSLIFVGEKTQYKTMAVLGIVMLGFLVGIDGEVNFSFLGTCSGVLSSVFVSMNSIYTKKISRDIELDNAQLLYYNNFNACVLFIPLMVLFEYNTIYLHAEKLFSVFFWCSMTLTGFVGFAIGLVTVMQVNATSPLTHNISGTAKAGVQSLMAFYIWGNQPTLKGILGIFLVLGGSLAYTYLQRLANEEARKAQKAAKEDSSAVQEGMVTPGKSSDPNYRKNAESNV